MLCSMKYILSLYFKHDSMNEHEGWMCESVEVYNTRNGKTWMFQCNQWFSVFRTDGQTKRELYAQVMPLTGAPLAFTATSTCYIQIYDFQLISSSFQPASC